MKIELDELDDCLRVGSDTFWSNGDNRFEVVASRFQDAVLSDIPHGVSIKLCERVVGSYELFGRGSSRFEHTMDGSLVGHTETHFFLEDETIDALARQEFFNAALADAKRVLATLSQNDLLVVVSESVYEDVAYLSYSLKLTDQLIFDAEEYMDNIEQDVREVLEPPLTANWERTEQQARLAGGQGRVLRVRRIKDGQFGALKRLHPANQKNKERRARAYREVAALEILEGRGTPLLLESNASSWRDKNADLYVIMEWIDGPTLFERTHKKALSLDDALLVLRPLSLTIESAHGLEIFHRDRYVLVETRRGQRPWF